MIDPSRCFTTIVSRLNKNKKPFISILLASLLLLCGEVVLQVRSHIRYGQSVLNAVKGEETYVFNQEIGLKTLRSNAVIKGEKAVIESNSLGLRMSELPKVKPENEFWVAIIGASTVMGAFTRTNESTLSARLEDYLQAHSPDRRIRVVNAGIAGYGLANQRVMLEFLLSRYVLDGVVLYSGFNDISGYCKEKVPGDHEPTANHGLVDIELPRWLLTVELLTKNTVFLREIPAGKSERVDPTAINPDVYIRKANELIGLMADQVPNAIVVLNARAFRPDMTLEDQDTLSQTARYYNPCFTVQDLHYIYDLHNDILQDIAENKNVPVYDLMESLPGGKEYFGDASHFTDKGTDIAASLISRQIVSWLYEE